MTTKLYILENCPFGHRAVFAMHEKKLPFETVFFEKGKRPAELEALGRLAKSPTLFDGDAKVFDSQIVFEYLEDRYPQWPLLPTDASTRADVRKWMLRVNAELVPKYEAVVESKGSPDAYARARREFLDALAPWDAQLKNAPFLEGEELTAADIALYTLFPSIRRLADIQVPEEHVNLRAWVDRIAARPTAAAPRKE